MSDIKVFKISGKSISELAGRSVSVEKSLQTNIKGVQPINCRSGRIVLAFVRE